MTQILRIVVVIIVFIFMGCYSGRPTNIDSKEDPIYIKDSTWCLNYGTIDKKPVTTETYKDCMRRFGYIYREDIKND